MESPQMYWHIHHDRLAEFALGPVEERIAWIKSDKPVDEIETRLRLIRPVQRKMSGPAFKAYLVYIHSVMVRAEAKINRDTTPNGQRLFSKAHKACNRALDKFRIYEGAFNKELEILHKLECPNCPWNGETIFPGKEEPWSNAYSAWNTFKP